MVSIEGHGRKSLSNIVLGTDLVLLFLLPFCHSSVFPMQWLIITVITECQFFLVPSNYVGEHNVIITERNDSQNIRGKKKAQAIIQAKFILW